MRRGDKKARLDTEISTKDKIPIQRIIPKVEVDCFGFKPDLNISIEHSCFIRPTGSLEFNSSIDYYFSIDGGKNFSDKKLYNDLSPGAYSLKVMNQQGCKYDFKEVIVKENNVCELEDVFFNPSIGEFWDLSQIPLTNGDLQIFDRNGQSVFESKISDNYQWDGYSKNGHPLLSGAYSFTIVNESKKVFGTVNIIK